MNAPDPVAMIAAMAAKRSELLSQCPPLIESPAQAPSAINVIELGNGGATVLFVHGGVQGGLGGGPATFDGQRVLAERNWQLKMVERPGFGSSASRGVDDMEADAEWIADMLGDGAHLVGHSWGGAEALLAAARRPDAVRSLTMIEPSLFPIIMTDAALRADPAMQAIGGQMAQLLFRSTTPADYAIGFARSILGPPGDVEAGARIAELEANPDQATSAGCALLLAKMATPQAMRAAADTVAERRIPVLVITGGWSPFFDRTSDVVARFTGGRLETVPSANHMVQAVSAHRFNAILEEFMRQADAHR